MLNDRQVGRYLERLAYHGTTVPTRTTLDALHMAHLLQVPFENYDIMLGVPIELSIDAFYRKIVDRRRGGFCYELNALFSALLQALGFKVSLLAAGVFKGEGYGDELDHLLLGIDLDGKTLIADVGFGDCFRAPLALDGMPSPALGTRYHIETEGDYHILYGTKPHASGKPQYRFMATPHALSDFAERCHYQQTAPQSHFTRRAVCSIATETGRLTLADGRYIVTLGEARSEWPVEGEAACRVILQNDFGIVLGAACDVSRLLAVS